MRSLIEVVIKRDRKSTRDTDRGVAPPRPLNQVVGTFGSGQRGILGAGLPGRTVPDDYSRRRVCLTCGEKAGLCRSPVSTVLSQRSERSHNFLRLGSKGGRSRVGPTEACRRASRNTCVFLPLSHRSDFLVTGVASSEFGVFGSKPSSR